jgi:hypothetical protein
VACGAELGVGRFCLNCGHPIGAPAPPPPEVVEHPPIAPPVQAADPTPVAPTSPPDLSDEPTTAPPAARPAPTRPSQARPAARPTPAHPAPTAVVPPTPRQEWDPSEDLLPYEEVDDVDEPPIRGRAWIAWVLGAVLLVGLVMVLIRVFATDDTDVATDPADGTSSAAPQGTTTDDAGSTGDSGGSGDGSSEEPRGVGRLTDLARGATFAVPGTAAPTTDLDGNLVAYEASQMGDGNPATAWRSEGDATGETITITLAQPSVVTRVGLVNGYAKQVAGVDWYPNNRRVLAVTWGFDDGTTLEQTFAERPSMQRITVPPTETATVTITFNQVTPPGSGNLGRDYTAISEVTVMGRRAG